MKKYLISLFAVLAFIAPAMAQMEKVDFKATVVGNTTQAVSYVLRGEVMGIFCNTTLGTATVSVASSEQTIFSKAAIAADAMFNVRGLLHDAGGTNITRVSNATNLFDTIYEPVAVAGPVTVTIIGVAGSTFTNDWTVGVIYKK